MSVVDEYIGTARFIFKKLRTPVGDVRFNYVCLRYENYCQKTLLDFFVDTMIKDMIIHLRVRLLNRIPLRY